MDQRLSEQYHRGNTKTSEIHWGTSEIHNFSRETQIINTHWGGRKSKPFSPGTDFAGLISTGELFGVDSAGVVRQGVLTVPLEHIYESNFSNIQALFYHYSQLRFFAFLIFSFTLFYFILKKY